MSERPETAEGLRGPMDDDDHDLLTFGEAGERLRIEIDTVTKQIGELLSTPDTEALDKARARLQALQAAATRNAADPANDANFAKFFGYAAGTRDHGDNRSQ